MDQLFLLVVPLLNLINLINLKNADNSLIVYEITEGILRGCNKFENIFTVME